VNRLFSSTAIQRMRWLKASKQKATAPP